MPDQRVIIGYKSLKSWDKINLDNEEYTGLSFIKELTKKGFIKSIGDGKRLLRDGAIRFIDNLLCPEILLNEDMEIISGMRLKIGSHRYYQIGTVGGYDTVKMLDNNKYQSLIKKNKKNGTRNSVG